MKQIKQLVFFAAALLLLGGSSIAAAQDAQTPEQRKAAQQTRRQELMEKIEKLKYERMKTALALDDETAVKFFQIYKPAEKEVQEIVKQRNDEMRKLTLLMNGAKTDADVDPVMQKIRELNQKIITRQEKLDGELAPVLSPRQRARLLVFEQQFNRRIREQIAQRQLGNGFNPRVQELRRELMRERMKNRMLKRGIAKPPGGMR